MTMTEREEKLEEIRKATGMQPYALHRLIAGKARWQFIRGRKYGEDGFDYRFRCSRCGALTPERGYPIAPDWCHGCGAWMN